MGAGRELKIAAGEAGRMERDVELAVGAIVYGVIPAAAPLIIVGTTVLGIAASKADWRQFGAALAVVITGVVAAFVGPSGAWLAAGIGLLIGMVGYAAADALRRRRLSLQA